MPGIMVSVRLPVLGHRIRDSVEHEDRPEIRGMVRKVMHLVVVEELEGAPERPAAYRRPGTGGRA
ncbi:MAG: hypothetical protein GEV08_21685 [Acidimicrobiia bacterium]|nr:hypothetical protein [Acidimicrobiia bacterium]